MALKRDDEEGVGTDLVIDGGHVVAATWEGTGTVEVRQGRVSGVSPGPWRGTSFGGKPSSVIDATGMWVLPGGVDPHVHLDMHLGQASTQDSGAELSHAALLGGTTTLLIHAIPTHGEELPTGAIDRIKHNMAGAPISYAVHACVPGWVEDPRAELRRCWELGARTVKVFTTYRQELMINPYQLMSVLDEAALLGAVVLVHAESDEVVQWATDSVGSDDVTDFMRTRPEGAEVWAVGQVLVAAKLTGASVYFVHLSTPEAVALVHSARRKGTRALAESCPHYLLLDDSAYSGGRGELFLCCPPLRSKATMEQMRNELRMGRLDSIGSDHCCYNMGQKATGRQHASTGPMGLPGVQLRNALILDLVAQGELALRAAVHLLAEKPAKLAGLFPRKGALAEGSDADIAVWDPALPWTVRSSELAMATDYTPFEAQQLRVSPRYVFRDGQLVAGAEGLGPGATAKADEFLVGTDPVLQASS